MKTAWMPVLAAVLLLPGCGERESASTEKAKAPAASGNPITAPVDYLGAVGKAKKSAERTVDLASVNRAIQMFYGMEDRYPKDLQELVAKQYLPALPAAPPGTRLIYDRSQGQARFVRQ